MRPAFLKPLAFSLLALSLGGAPALAQYDSRGLYDRIDRLERDLQMMQAQAARGAGAGGATVITSPALGGGVSGGGAAPAPLSPALMQRLDDRVDQLEDMVRQLTGKVEEANFKSQQAVKQLERLQADIDLRFKDLQSGTAQSAAPAAQQAAPNTGVSMPAAKGDTPPPASGPQILGSMPDKDLKKLTPPVKMDPQSQYDAAYKAAQAGDYATAERGFQDFLAKNPSHELAGNAQYWMGEMAYSRKDYASAASTFLEGYKKYPKNGKAADMIYKAGSSLGLMGKKKEACTAFAILFSDQPGMPDRVKRAAQAEKQKYDCR